MGVVEVREGPGDPEFPPTMEVEQLPPRRMLLKAVAAVEEEKETRGLSHEPDKPPQDVDLTNIEKVHRFPFGLVRR
jgi:hypothetical protein